MYKINRFVYMKQKRQVVMPGVWYLFYRLRRDVLPIALQLVRHNVLTDWLLGCSAGGECDD
jgi:hypothetical protein